MLLLHLLGFPHKLHIQHNTKSESQVSLYDPEKWVAPCHHDMASLQVLDCGEGLRDGGGVAEDILHNVSWTVDKRCSSSFGVG